MKKYGNVIDFLDDGEELDDGKMGFGIALKELDDGRFSIEMAVLGSDAEAKVLGYLNDRECADAFAKIIQVMASGNVETRVPSDDEIDRYFNGRGK